MGVTEGRDGKSGSKKKGGKKNYEQNVRCVHPYICEF